MPVVSAIQSAMVVVILALPIVGWQQVKVSSAKAQLADIKVKLANAQLQLANEREVAATAAFEVLTAYRQVEASLLDRAEKTEHAKQAEREALERVIADLRIERVRDAKAIASFAAGGRRTTPDTADACRERAAVLGDEVGDLLREAEEDTTALVTADSDIRALLADARSIRNANND